MCYSDLYDPENAAKYFVALDEIAFESVDKGSLICLGLAIQEKFEEFDKRFENEKLVAPDSINLWIAFTERHKKSKSIDEIIEQMPISVKNSIPVLVHVGARLIADGRKIEGLSTLRKALEHPELNSEKFNDSKALVATYIMQEAVNQFNYKHKNFTSTQLDELQHAKRMLSEVWNEIGNTEVAPSKWYVIGNRGVINKIIGTHDEALEDLKKAWELSEELVPFKNYFLTLLELKRYSVAEQILKENSSKKKITDQERFELRGLESDLLCRQGKYIDAVKLLSDNIPSENVKEEVATISDIASICMSNDDLERAQVWVNRLIHDYPNSSMGYYFSGKIHSSKNEKAAAFDSYVKANDLISSDTPEELILGLAEGFMQVDAFSNAIPLFERIAKKDVLNDISRGLISAYYLLGDLEASLVLAENLYSYNKNSLFLCDVITRIFEETRQFDKAIDTMVEHLPHADIPSKDLLNFRIARLHSFKRDWDGTKVFALKVKHLEKLSLQDAFRLAYLLIKTGEKEYGRSVAFDARTNFYDESGAHSRYIQVLNEFKTDSDEIYLSEVKPDCAVVVTTNLGEQKSYIITDKRIRDENSLKTTEYLAQLLIGKSKGETLKVNKGFGLSYYITIDTIIELHTYAYQKSMSLFSGSFEGKEGIGILTANPGGENDEVEKFIRHNFVERQNFEAQVNDLYQRKNMPLGVMSQRFNRNSVMQWFSMLSSRDISIICLRNSEIQAVENTIVSKRNIVIELSALLTTFFLCKDHNLLSKLHNKLIVSQSTVDEMLECYDELERNAQEGMLTLGIEKGKLAAHLVPRESIVGHRKTLIEIIEWCKSNTIIATPSKLINVDRETREKHSKILGSSVYDTLLLCEEFSASAISDDDNFKQMLRGEYGTFAFSIHQLAQWMVRTNLVGSEMYERLCLQLVICNYAYIPLTFEQLWECFDKSGFQIEKPFTVGVMGLLVSPANTAGSHLVKFFKKLYLESGLVTTRDQVVLFCFAEVSKRVDFTIVKKAIIEKTTIEFRLIQDKKDELLTLLSTF